MAEPGGQIESEGNLGHGHRGGTRTTEAPYEANDLQGRRRDELVAIVKRQIGRWPYTDARRKFNARKANMKQMWGVLLNPEFGFTKQVEVPESPSGHDERPCSCPGTPGPLESNWNVGNECESQTGGRDVHDGMYGASPTCSPSILSHRAHGGWSPGRDDGDTEDVDLGVGMSQTRVSQDSDDIEQLSDVEVDVYVTFLHPGLEAARNVFSIEAPQVSPLNHLTHEWQTDTQLLIERLLRQAPQLEGATEVSYPDPAHPEYSRRLKSARGGCNVINAHPDVPVIHVPADNSLMLTVSFSLAPVAPAPSRHVQQAVVLADDTQRVPPTVRWLTEQAQSREGYTAFKQGQHHVQTNAAIVVSWWFAVLFSEHYSHTFSPVQALDSQRHKRLRRIRKCEVQSALGVGSTWMSEATNAVALLRQFGENGVTPREHVIRMCKDNEAKIGARALLANLRCERERA